MSKFSVLLSLIPGKIGAKGKGWLPLLIHLKDTVYVMQRLVREWLPGNVKRIISDSDADLERLCIFLAMIHDIGKLTSVMTSKMLEKDSTGLIRSRIGFAGLSIPDFPAFRADAFETSHALAGEAILLKKGVAKGIASIIGAHHGMPQKRNAAKTQIEKFPKNFFGDYSDSESAGLWRGMWDELIDAALKEAGYEFVSDLPVLSAKQQMILTGLVVYADWTASNSDIFPLIPIDDDGSHAMDGRYKDLRLSLPSPYIPKKYKSEEERFRDEFGFKPNQMQRNVIDLVKKSEHPGLLIIEAQMASGKTEAALVAAELIIEKTGAGGIFFGAPTAATADGIFRRILSWAEKQSEDSAHSIRLAHAASGLNETYDAVPIDSFYAEPEAGLMRYGMYERRQMSLLPDFVAGTIDQALMSSLKQRHVMTRHLGLVGKVVILDEVHAYDAYMSQYLDRMLEWLGAYGVPVIVLSATLPSEKRDELIKAYTGKSNISLQKSGYPLITLTDGDDIVQKVLEGGEPEKKICIIRGTDDDVSSYIKEQIKNGGCAGVIVNTVKKAQEMYDRLGRELPEMRIVLHHAGFEDGDRAEDEARLIKEIGKGSEDEDRKGLVVIGSPVLEQSLDIDFDCLVTDSCPIDLLLQRTGRLWRHERKRYTDAPSCLVLNTEKPDAGSTYIYGSWLLRKTDELLPDTLSLPSMIEPLVQKAYATPTEEELLIPEARSMYEAHVMRLKDKEERAKSFRLPSVAAAERFGTLDSLLDGCAGDSGCDAEAKERAAEASVRDGMSGIDVLLMTRHENGDVGFQDWVENGRSVATDSVPDDGTAKEMRKRKITLPKTMCSEREISGTLNALKETDAKAGKWLEHPLLKHQHFIFLNEEGKAELNGFLLCYDRKRGLSCKKL